MGQGTLSICFVTKPFGFEGDARVKSAERVLPQIEEHTDSMVVIPLDDLFVDAGKELLDDSIKAAEEIVATGVTLLWRLLTKPGFIRLDAERLYAMVFRGGNARLGFSVAEGAGRAERAVMALKNCRLLRSGDALTKANAVMLGIHAGSDLRLSEVGEIMATLRSLCKKDCIFEMGTVLDDRYDGRIELVALAFESWSAGIPIDPPKDSAAPAAQESPAPEAFPIQPGSSRKKRPKAGGSKLSFGATGRGRFHNVETTIYKGQDLDVPTYIRREITLER
jgi:Cell division GTPase